MPTIELEEQDARTVRDALEQYVSDLGMEISNTEDQPMREALKREREVLERLIRQLPAGRSGA